MIEPKFHIGDLVKYIGDSKYLSPPKGTVGTVAEIGAAGLDFMVKFGHPLDPIWWYHFDELEAVGADRYKYDVVYAPIEDVDNVRV